jgi:hypothetical protein
MKQDQSESGDDSSGVVIPEEFQQQAHKLLSRADKHQLNHVSDRISARREELMMAEQEKNSEKSGKKNAMPSVMSSDGMPQND